MVSRCGLPFQDCCLIVYHPYRPLLQYVQDMGQEDMLLPLAWSVCFPPALPFFGGGGGSRPLFSQYCGASLLCLPPRRIVNDTYRTDLCLLYPPFMIALGADNL